MNDHLPRLKTALADRYAIQQELGSGGMATVYLAEDLKHHRNVAVKVLRPELAAVLGAERFLKEIEVTANLQHPHILPLHDSGEADSFLFYVMPYVEGETLRDKLGREKQLSIEEAVAYTTGIAAALDYAHRHDVVHRDIKPENILLHDGQPVVADFGIALAVSAAGGHRITETGMSLGTPHYMSPEQAMGDRELDARSDVYSLACVTYEMLVGEPPHTGPTAQAIVAKVITDRPQPLTLHRDTVPPHVHAAVHKALEKLPADRFATAAQFAEAITNPAFTVRTETATAVGVAGVSPKRRHSLANWQLALGAVMMLMAGVVVGAWRGGGGPPATGPIARFVMGVQLGDADVGGALALSRDARELVYVGVGEEGGVELYRRSLGETEAVAVPGTRGVLGGMPFFSPDGSRVGFYSDLGLHTVDLAGGGSRPITRMSPVGGGASWAPNDLIVYNSDPGTGLMVVAAEGGEPRVLTTVDSVAGEADHRWPHVLPDGRTVVFTIWRGSLPTARLAVTTLETGEVRELLDGTYGQYVDGGYLIYATSERLLRAVRFDMQTGEVEGSPITVLNGVTVRSDGAGEFSVSANGTLAYLSAEASLKPTIVDSDGSTTPLPLIPTAQYQAPRLSPDGNAFAVGRDNDIWIYDFRLETFVPLTIEGGFYPVWTPDGESVMFSRGEGADVHVYSARGDHSEDPVILVNLPGQHRMQDVSPDGRHVVLRRNVGGGAYDLWTLALEDESAPEEWLATDALERAPTFSPDGAWVAYSSDESGRDEIYVLPFPGPGGRIPVSTRGGTEPAWSRDGSRLFYRSGNRLEMVTVETQPTFRVLSRPTTLLEGRFYNYAWQRQYDVHPDGDRFLMLQYSEEASEVTVVVNFVEELRERFAN